MANSITFNGADLSAYNLTVLSHGLPAARESAVSRVENRGIAGSARLVPREITLEVFVQGTSVSNVMGLVDSILGVLNTSETAELTVGLLSDRYWLAKFVNMTGDLLAQKYWQGTVTFLAADPLAYDTTETDNDYNIDADPKDVEETAGGTAEVRPVFTLTAGEDLTGASISIENRETGDSLTWEGDIDNGEVLTIDSERWVVELEGTADMADVSGEFPTLLAGTANTIRVTGFGSLGSLNITYRDRYL